MGTVSNVYYLVHDSVHGSGCEESTDIRFIYGDGIVTAQLETEWFDFENGNDDQLVTNFAEERCTAGNRVCALVRAIERHDYSEAEFHCGCRGERGHSHYIGQSFEDILNLTECVLQSSYDDVADPFR